MHTPRALVAADPRRFGRGMIYRAEVLPERRQSFADDMQLFAATFAAGFVFVSVLIS